jgi:hypothetical protein
MPKLAIMKENRIKGIMAELIENKKKKSEFEIFLSTEEVSPKVLNEHSDLGKKRAAIYDILMEAKERYTQKTKANEKLFQELASLETTIIQARSILTAETKLTMINQKRGGSETSYVAARAPFFNPNNVKAEIRVYLGKSEEIGDDLEKLSKDSKFMKNAEKLIVNAMIEIMEANGPTAKKKKKRNIMKLALANEG